MKDLFDVAEQEEIENDGVWVPFGDEGQIMVAAIGNPDYTKKRISLEKQVRRKHNIAANKELPEEVGEDMQRRAIFETVLKGWRGGPFEFDPVAWAEKRPGAPAPPQPPSNGNPTLPFTEGNVLWYMNLSKRFRRTVLSHAAAEDTFDRDNLDILGKASGR